MTEVRLHAGGAPFPAPRVEGYALLDSGGGAKLERFGPVVLARPDPVALWRKRRPEAWERADLSFERESDRGGRWLLRRGAPPEAGGRDPRWPLALGGASIEIRPTSFKHVGLFPEQAANWDWVERAREELGESPALLNLFGYTGVASILAARAGYRVTHVDASRASLGWMRANVRASGLAEDAIRVQLEDAAVFAAREARRGSRYDGILLDPPHYGRGPKGERWVFEEGIAPLLASCAELLAERAFVVLSTYAIGTSPLATGNLLADLEGGEVVAGELALAEEEGGRLLPCGFCARWTRGLSGTS